MFNRNLLLVFLLAAAVQIFSFKVFADEKAPHFSAFSSGDSLYVTLLADTCNTMHGSLRVNALCRSDRLTRNYAIECDAELMVTSTRMACPDGELKPRVFTISLSKSKVAPEARVLHLQHAGETIDVKLNQQR